MNKYVKRLTGISAEQGRRRGLADRRFPFFTRPDPAIIPQISLLLKTLKSGLAKGLHKPPTATEFERLKSLPQKHGQPYVQLSLCSKSSFQAVPLFPCRNQIIPIILIFHLTVIFSGPWWKRRKKLPLFSRKIRLNSYNSLCRAATNNPAPPFKFFVVDLKSQRPMR